MLVVMQSHATEEQVRVVCQRIESLGLKAHPIPGSLRTAIGITGNKGEIDLGVLESLPGVVECIPVSKPYKLVSRDAKEEDTILRIPTPSGDVLVGGEHVALVAGPIAWLGGPRLQHGLQVVEHQQAAPCAQHLQQQRQARRQGGRQHRRERGQRRDGCAQPLLGRRGVAQAAPAQPGKVGRQVLGQARGQGGLADAAQPQDSHHPAAVL